ncbi:DUF3592 domain-containing protein [Ancylomarina longa]|uniref:DUF3592 domain-containing protein n=1 Tax=Ancylomarina longa TaxID=2487017 RepID=A0A434AZ94_9BACT|nr:DUF3592 domain-containing protein [Ancylomarina longa]RUT79941.1 hypothetical protein DLK05_00895 [Ancylomarina longa]
MKDSGWKFFLITILIVLIPVYGNWKLLLHGEKTQGTVVKMAQDNLGPLLSFYAIIEFQTDGNSYTLMGPENVKYPIGKKFTILFRPAQPDDAIIFSARGVYFNKYTPVAVVLFILWIAFYLSFCPKSKRRKSVKDRFIREDISHKKKLL